MNIDDLLKRIRVQIKHGRTEGVEEKLEELVQRYTGTEEEASILEVYALDYLSDAGLYERALPQLERLVSLDVGGGVKSRALALIAEYKRKTAIVQSEVLLTNPEFLEFVSVVRSEEIFDFDAGLDALVEYEVTRDLETARKLAWHQNIADPHQSWNSLREKAAGQVSTYCAENKINTKPLRKLDAEIDRICERKLSDVMMNFYDDISADLAEIAKSKAVGISIDLHEKMWEAYQKKAFPCGWNGKFPLGKLCVFIP